MNSAEIGKRESELIKLKLVVNFSQKSFKTPFLRFKRYIDTQIYIEV